MSKEGYLLAPEEIEFHKDLLSYDIDGLLQAQNAKTLRLATPEIEAKAFARASAQFSGLGQEIENLKIEMVELNIKLDDREEDLINAKKEEKRG